MSADTYLKEALIRHQIYLQRYAGGVVKDTDVVVDEYISDAVEALESGDLTRIKLALREIEPLDSRVSPIIYDAVGDITPYEAAYMETLLFSVIAEEIVRTAPEILLPLVSNKPMSLVGTTGEITKLTIREMISDFSDSAAVAIEKAIIDGIANGDSIATISRRMQKVVGRGARNRAETITRTIVNHVCAQARDIATRANQEYLLGEEFVATLDRNTTLICIKYDSLGEIYALDKGPFPPLHYRCRSLRAPKVKPEYEIKGLVGRRPAVGMDEEGNKLIEVVRGDTRYAGFLRNQPKQFQDFVLGPRRAALFRSRKIKVENFVDDDGRVVLLSDLVDKDGNVIVH